MIDAVPEPASTLIAAAAFTGARRGELRGMFWENYLESYARWLPAFYRGLFLLVSYPLSFGLGAVYFRLCIIRNGGID